MAIPLITLFVFAPLAGAVLLMLIPARAARVIQAIALTAALVPLVAGTYVFFALPSVPASPPASLVPAPAAARSSPGAAAAARCGADLKFVEDEEWIDVLGLVSARYFLGVDGLSAPMLPLVAIVSFAVLLAAMGRSPPSRGTLALLLVFSTAANGIVCSLDFLLFAVFWGGAFIPLLFLAGSGGGAERTRAAVSLALAGVAGFALIVIVLLALQGATATNVRPAGTLNLPELARRAGDFVRETPWLGGRARFDQWLFGLLFAALAAPIAVLPFQGRWVRTLSRSFTPASALLAGVLAPVGVYGLLRIAVPIFPSAAADFAFPLAILAAAGMLLGGLCARLERDWKARAARAAAVSMGGCLLGIATVSETGVQGALLQASGGGLAFAMLLLSIGTLEGRAGGCGLGGSGGNSGGMPRGARLAVVATLAAVSIPGFAGFWGGLTVLIAAFQAGARTPATPAVGFAVLGLAALVGWVLASCALIRALRGACSGPAADATPAPPDLDLCESASLAILGAFALALGIWPSLLLDATRSAAGLLAAILQAAARGGG